MPKYKGERTLQLYVIQNYNNILITDDVELYSQFMGEYTTINNRH